MTGRRRARSQRRLCLRDFERVGEMVERRVEIREIHPSDLPFLIISGLDRERRDVQYAAKEWRKQFRIAPMRYFRAETRKRSRLIVVDGRRAGYVGLNPLSRNIEYYLQPWARGGVGRRAITDYLRGLLPSAKDEHAFMLPNNDRSVQVFRRSLLALCLEEGTDFEYFTYDGGSGFRIMAGTATRC